MEGIVLAKKGTKFSSYSDEFKAEAIRLYEEEHLSYRTIVEILGLKSRTQVAEWVKKSRSNNSLADQGKVSATIGGRQKITFSSVEEELAYVKAERDYLKKLYQTLFVEVSPRK